MSTSFNPSVAHATTAIAAAIKGGFRCLGTEGNKCVIFSLLTMTIVRLAPAEMKEMELMSVCGADWVVAYYSYMHPKKDTLVVDHRGLATDIIRGCQEIGPYVAAFERPCGVYAESDGTVIVNGKQAWKPETGEVVEHGIRDGRIYPAGGDTSFTPHTPEATDDMVARVLRAFGALQWGHALAAELLLGWFGVAIVAAALRRRPHLLITASAGIGKSTMLVLMKWLLGIFGHAVTGPQSSAALYQALRGRVRAVLVDEFEADPRNGKSKATLEIARMSYSLQETDEGVTCGTPGGTVRSYRFYSPFIAAGVSPGRMEPADQTRWVVLEAIGRKPDAFMMSEAEAREIGPQLATRFIKRWSVFKASEEVVRERIILAGGDGRMADTVGTLLASYLTFISDKPATVDEVDALVAKLDIAARKEVHAETDEKRCLDALLSKVMPFKYQEGPALVTRSLSIAEAIQRVCEAPMDNDEVVRRLAQLGLRVTRRAGRWQLFVVNSPEHQELRKVFMGTKWSTGGWSTVLRRLPGGGEETQRIGAGFGAAKVTVFDVPTDLLPPDEGEELLAA